MNEYAITILAISAIGSLTVLLFRCIMANERMSGASTRSKERENRDRDNLLLMLIEKRDINPERVANLHAKERMQTTQIDAGLERAMGAKSKNGPPRKTAPAPKPQNVEDWADAMHQ